MALNAGTTASEIVTAIEGIRGAPIPDPHRAESVAYWSAIIGVLYSRIKADIIITSQVASGITVSIPTTSSAGNPSTGATSAPGTATSQVVT